MAFLSAAIRLGPGAGPYVLFLGLGFPSNPLNTKKRTLFIPRLPLGLLETWQIKM